MSDLLVRAGTGAGFVYETYLLGPRILAYGEKPQLGDAIDVASLQLDKVRPKNNEVIYDRTRFVLHLNGMRWTGTPAGQSATNAELSAFASWSLVYTTANRVGATCILTNG
ncbi:MAG: hypothetical protein JNN07_27405 [Verrucomicrobiales bacterium]|nr:hypothetical protein [Verrucomicrobiales bacterium]